VPQNILTLVDPDAHMPQLQLLEHRTVNEHGEELFDVGPLVVEVC
jgi:hypothetical protein